MTMVAVARPRLSGRFYVYNYHYEDDGKVELASEITPPQLNWVKFHPKYPSNQKRKRMK